MAMKKMTDYKNFWLIWLTTASEPNGTTLFKIQKEWNISTNYLYHKESGIRKPLFKEMIAEGYLREENKKLFARFEWITDYIMVEYKHKIEKQVWSPNLFIIKTWPHIQKFIEENQSIFFNIDKIKTLYKNDIKTIRKVGFTIFSDILLSIYILNIIPFCMKYNANVVVRIIYTLVTMASEKNFYGYFNSIRPFIEKNPNFPKIIPDEKTLLKVLAPL